MEDQIYALQTADKAAQIEREETLAQLGRVTFQAVSTEAEGCYLQTQLAAATADCEVEKAMHRQCKATLAALEMELQRVNDRLEKEQETLREKSSSADSISTMQIDACRGVYLLYVLYSTVLYCVVMYYTNLLYPTPLNSALNFVFHLLSTNRETPLSTTITPTYSFSYYLLYFTFHSIVFCFIVEKEGIITTLESEVQGLQLILSECKDEINECRENERLMKDNDNVELSILTLQLDAVRAELQSTRDELVILEEKYVSHTEQAENDLLALKESSAQELLFLGNVLSESKEKSKVMRGQLDGLGVAIEAATSALKLSESTLEDRDRALSDAQAGQQLYEAMSVTSEAQCASLRSENLQLQLLLEQSIHDLEKVREQISNMDMYRDKDTAIASQKCDEKEVVDRDVSITSAPAIHAAASLQVKNSHVEGDVKTALIDRLEERLAVITAELQDEKKRVAETKVRCGVLMWRCVVWCSVV